MSPILRSSATPPVAQERRIGLRRAVAAAAIALVGFLPVFPWSGHQPSTPASRIGLCTGQ